MAHDGPADRDTLALATGEFRRIAVEIVLQVQHAGRLCNALVDHLLALLFLLERQCHVVAHVQMRIKRVALEHHGNAAFGRRRRVHDLPADADLAGGDVFKTCDHPQQGGLATP